MRRKMFYECGVCGKASVFYEEIRECEAAHLGITVAEMQQWEKLNRDVDQAATAIYVRKNERTEKDFDKALGRLVDFEKKHGLRTGEAE